MKELLLIGLSFVAGLAARDLVVGAYSRMLVRRWSRDGQRAQERMRGCSHERTVMVDYGMGATTKKCLGCWAIYIDHVPVPHWNANVTPPPGEK